MAKTHITVEHETHAAAPTATADAATAHHASAFDLVAAQPWAMTPAMLETISAIARRENESPEAVEARLGRPLQNTRTVSMQGSVAVVPMIGPMMRYANMFSRVSGATSLEQLAQDFTAAAEDQAVSAIVLNIDSPGGQAAGISEFAQMVRAATKPVVAYVDGTAASAAYWIAAAADSIVVSKTAEVGSIGAVVAIDTGKKSGGSIEIVSSQSPNKRVDVTTDEGRSLIQARIDAFAQVFIEDVAAYRGTTVENVLAEFGQGDMRMGAAAVALGMADRIGTLDSVLASLNTAAPAAGSPRFQSKGTTVMNLEELRAAHPELVTALLAEGAATGATAERTRILDIEAQAHGLPGHDDLVASLKADGKTTGPMAAVAILAAERSLAARRVAALRADAPAPVAHAAAPASEASDQSPEEKAKAKWDADAGLRAEFGGIYTAYLAYERAAAAGSVRGIKK